MHVANRGLSDVDKMLVDGNGMWAVQFRPFPGMDLVLGVFLSSMEGSSWIELASWGFCERFA